MSQTNLINLITQYLELRYRNRPNYHLGTSLSVISAVAGTALKCDESAPKEYYGDIYVCLLGPSNSGKSTICEYGIDILKQIGYTTHIISHDITPEDFINTFKNKKYVLMRISEFSSLLSSYKVKGYMSGTREKIIAVYDHQPLIQSRSTKGQVTVVNYSMTALGDTQPEILKNFMTIDDISSGFLPRFLWFVENSSTPIPPRVLDEYGLSLKKQIIDWLDILYRFAQNNTIRFIYTQEQVDRIFTLTNTINTDQTLYTPFYSRVVELIYKLSLIHAFASDETLHNVKKYITSSDIIEDSDEIEHDQGWINNIAMGGSYGSEYTDKSKSKSLVIRIPIYKESLDWALEFADDYISGNLKDVISTLSLTDADKIREIVKHYTINLGHQSMPYSLLIRRASSIYKDVINIDRSIEYAIKARYIMRKKTSAGISFTYVSDKEISKMEDEQENSSHDWISNVASGIRDDEDM